MNKLFMVLTLMFGLWAAQGCSKSPNDDKGKFYLDISRLEIVLQSGDATTDTLSVNCSEEWSTLCNADWIKLSPDSGASGKSTVVIKISANDTGKERSASINFKALGYEKSVKVAQPIVTKPAVIEPIMKLLTTSNIVEAASGSFTIDVEANCSWEVKSMPEWVTSITPNKDSANAQVTVLYSEQVFAKVRTGKIIFTYNNKELDFVITQNGPAPFCNYSGETSFTTDLEAIDETLEILSNTSWTASSSVSWLKVTQSVTEGNGELTIKAEKNTVGRVAVVKIKAEGCEDIVINLTQKGPLLPDFDKEEL